MAIAYDPKDAVMILPAGEYNAILKEVKETQSKAGNDMFVLTWEVHPEDARPTMLITDYIVMPKFTFKLKRLAKSMGKLADFENRVFQPEDYIGASTRVFLEVEVQQGFDDKNVISRYVEQSSSPANGGMSAALRAQLARAERDGGEPHFAPDSKVSADLIPF